MRAARFFIISVPWWICSPPTAITRTEPKQEPATCRMFWARSMQKNSRRNWTLSLPAASTWTFRRRRFRAGRRPACRKEATAGRCRADSRHVTKTGDGSTAEGWRVIPQKQEGLYAVAYHPIGGCPNPEQVSGDLRRHQGHGPGGASGGAGRDRLHHQLHRNSEAEETPRQSPVTAPPTSLRPPWPASAHPSARWA